MPRFSFNSICITFTIVFVILLEGYLYTSRVSYCPYSVSSLKRYTQGYKNFILDITRKTIEVEMWDYNYTHSGVNNLEDLLLEHGGKPVRSVIVSSWRSGSSFLGELLNESPGNFYNYEPLMKYGALQIRGSLHGKNSSMVIKEMLKCNFTGMENFYFEYSKKIRKTVDQIKINKRLWDKCSYKRDELCYDPDFVSNVCKLFPFQSMKTVRIRLPLVETLLEDKNLNARVVFLIRDPRAVLQSRKKFCGSNDCKNPKTICADMYIDYIAASTFSVLYPDRFIQRSSKLSSPSSQLNQAGRGADKRSADVDVSSNVKRPRHEKKVSTAAFEVPGPRRVLRYEDFILDIEETTDQLLKFLRRSRTPSINEFLQTHTNASDKKPFSTFRVSRDIPFKWKKLMNFSYVEEIQKSCKTAMSKWGYVPAIDSAHMESDDFHPVQPFFFNDLL